MQATGRLAPMRTRPGAPAVMPGDLGNAEQNAVRWLVRSLGLLRVAQLVPGTVVVLTAAWAYHSATLCASMASASCRPSMLCSLERITSVAPAMSGDRGPTETDRREAGATAPARARGLARGLKLLLSRGR